jgi:hypothetical protein
MKKTFILIAIALFSVSAYAQTLQTLWSNASPATYSWNASNMSRETALFNGKLYVANNNGANSAVYVIDTATGLEIPTEKIADARLTGFGIAADDAGNLVVPANTAGPAAWALNTIIAGTVDQLADFNGTARVDYLSIFGNIASTTTPAYVVGASTTTANIVAWEMLNGVRTETPAMIFDRGQVAVAADIKRIDDTRFLLTQQSTSSAPAPARIMTVDFTATPWITQTDIIAIDAPTDIGGGVYFEMGGTPYLVIPYGASASLGAVAIFDVTDITAPVQLGETTAAIGSVANGIFHLSINVSIVSDTEAVIYVWAPNVGAAAYTFETAPPAGWYDDPAATTFYIGTAAELAELAALVNGTPSVSFDGRVIELTADIDLSAYNTGMGWPRIGTAYDRAFAGTFDGKGFTISNLYINSTATGNAHIGLFGYIQGDLPGDNCAIKNLNLIDVDVTSVGNRVGGLVGWVYGYTLIENVHVQGTVKGAGSVGGIFGGFGSDGTRAGAIRNSYADVDVIATGDNVGGIAGGLGNGIGTMHNCYVTGTVSGANNVGGLVGAGPTTGFTINCIISNSAALNITVKATGTNVGRISGISTGFTYENNVALADMGTDGGTAFSGVNAADGINGEDITMAEILAGDGTVGGRFTAANGWIIAAGQLPILFGEHSGVTMFTVTFDSQGGTPVASVEVPEGEKVAKPADPTKAGYKFEGWFIGETEWNFDNDVVTEAITLVAKWTENVNVPVVDVNSLVSIFKAQNGNFAVNVTSTILNAYTVYSIDGKMLRSGAATSNNIEIDASDLTTGIYLIQVNTAAGSVTKKVMK